MKDKVDLRKFLSGKVGDVLYSPLCGECILRSVSEFGEFCIEIEHMSTAGTFLLNKYGQLNEYGETMIFPSETGRDWTNHLLVGKGVLCSSDGEFWLVEKYVGGNMTKDFDGVVMDWEYIVRPEEFNFEDIKSNIKKSFV